MDKKAVERLKEFRKEAAKSFSVDKVIFFGSRARGKYHEDSDIDLIVVSKKFRGMGFFKRVAKMYDYWRLNYPVDFICYTPEEFERKKKEIGIVKQAVEEGIEVEA